MSTQLDRNTTLQEQLLPLEAQQELQEEVKPESPTLEELTRKIADRVENEDRPARLARKELIYTNRAYYRNQQGGAYSPVLDRYVPGDDENLRTINFIRQFVDRVCKEFESSKTELQVLPRTRKQTQVGAANLANDIADSLQQQLFTALFRQIESKNCKLCGEYYRLIYWDDRAGSMRKQPVTQPAKQQVGQESWNCNCGAAGYPQDLSNGLCPECGSDQLNVTSPEEIDIDIQVGTKMVPSGDFVLEGPDPLEVDLPLTARTLEEALWLRRKRRVPVEVLRAKFPDFHIENSMGDYDPSLAYQRILQTSQGAQGTAAFAAWSMGADYAVFEQYWLEPEEYFDWVSPQDEKMASGFTIKKGQKLIDLCPNGFYFARINGKLCDARPESKKDHWSHGRNIVVPGNIHGDGIEDLIDLQDLSNDLHSLVIMYLMRATCPPMLYDQETAKVEEFPNQPGMSVPCQLMPGQSLQQVAYQLEPSALPPLVGEYIESLKRNMLELAGAFSLDAGAPDVDNKTAHAAQLTHDSAVALNAVVLALKAEVDAKTITQALKIAREKWGNERYLPIKGEVGDYEVKLFKSADIPEDFIVTAVEGSWMPRSTTEERQDFMALMQSNAMMLPGDLKRYAFQIFSVPYDLDNSAIDEKLALKKLGRIQMAVQVAKQEGMSPELIVPFALQAVPIKPFVDEPQVGVAVITRWLKSDDGQDSSQELQQALMMRIQQYLQLNIQQQQFAQMSQMAASAPMQAAASAQQAQSQQKPQGSAGNNPSQPGQEPQGQ